MGVTMADPTDISDAEFQRLAKLEEMLLTFSVDASAMIGCCGKPVQEIADRASMSAAAVRRLRGGAAYRGTLEQIVHLTWACGYDIDVTLKKR